MDSEARDTWKRLSPLLPINRTFCQLKTYWCKPPRASIGKMMPAMQHSAKLSAGTWHAKLFLDLNE